MKKNIFQNRKRVVIGIFFLLIGFLMVGGLFVSSSQAQTSTCIAPSSGFLKGLGYVCYCEGICELCHFVQVFSNVIIFLRNKVAFWVLLIMAVVGGVMMMFSGASAKSYKAGWATFRTAIIGFFALVGITIVLNIVLVFVIGNGVTDTWQDFLKDTFNGELRCNVVIDRIGDIKILNP